MSIPKQPIDWSGAREAFVSRSERPSFKDLAEEFAHPYERMRAVAADEGWANLRLQRSAAALEKSDAHNLLLSVAQNQRVIADKFSAVAMRLTEDLSKILIELETKSLAPSTSTSLLNTCAFALSNLANALKSVGIVGLPRALMDEIENRRPSDKDAKDHLKQAIQQINITVQQARQGKPAEFVESPKPKPVYPVGGVHRAEAMAEAEGIHVETTEVSIPSKRTVESMEVSRMIRAAEKKSKEKWDDVL